MLEVLLKLRDLFLDDSFSMGVQFVGLVLPLLSIHSLHRLQDLVYCSVHVLDFLSVEAKRDLFLPGVFVGPLDDL